MVVDKREMENDQRPLDHDTKPHRGAHRTLS